MADAFRKLQLQYQAQTDEIQRRFDAVMEQQRLASEHKIAEIEAMMGALKQDRDIRADLQKTIVEGKMSENEAIVNAMAQLKLAEKKATDEHSKVILEGVLQELLQQQKAEQEKMLEYQKHVQSVIAEAMSAEREIVKDPKTGRKTVRIKMTGDDDLSKALSVPKELVKDPKTGRKTIRVKKDE